VQDLPERLRVAAHAGRVCRATTHRRPGRYELSAEAGAPWRVLSIVSEGRDITKQVIDLRCSQDDVVITLTRGSQREW